MKTRIFISVIFALALTSAAAAQSVVVTKKKITYTRPKPIAAHKKTFVINYPKIKAATPALSRKIEALLSYEKVFDFTIREEQTEVQWLEEADYEVEYNKNGLLCVKLTIEGTAAYPDGSTKYLVIDTKTGKRVLPGEVFVYTSGLVDKAKEKQRQEIAEAIVEIKKNKDWEGPEPEEMFENASFSLDDLKGFSIDEEGVTFRYDYGFPHAIEALEPDGEYEFTWAEMKPYIRTNSVLGRLVR